MSFLQFFTGGFEMKKIKTAIAILAVLLFFILIFFMSKKSTNPNKTSIEETVEVMDLYMDITPYGEMSYGDQYVSKEVFESLVYITEEFEIEPELAKKYEINENKIEFALSNNSFKLPDSEIELTNEYVIDYYNKLIRLSEANLISNPGILNIKEISQKDESIEIVFNSEKPYNILALAENIGYQGEEGKWYGTKSKVEYSQTDVKVYKEDRTVSYINSSLLPGLQNDKRFSNMILGKALADNTVNLEPIPNSYYGFITWGESGVKKFDKETRQAIFMALENSDIRKNITHKANSIYADTELYQKISITNNIETNKNSDILKMPSLKIGVVNLGSFNEVHKALEETFVEIGIPVIVETAELIDLLGGSEYDLVYIRLERGMSPDFSPLLASDGFIGKLDYSEDYSEEVSSINSALTWEELCKELAVLDKKLREDGVWLFLDRGYDLLSTRK